MWFEATGNNKMKTQELQEIVPTGKFVMFEKLAMEQSQYYCSNRCVDVREKCGTSITALPPTHEAWVPKKGGSGQPL